MKSLWNYMTYGKTVKKWPKSGWGVASINILKNHYLDRHSISRDQPQLLGIAMLDVGYKV